MIAFDTNVWARAFLNDDPVQSSKARTAIASARDRQKIYVPLLVIAELFWVLRGRWEKDRVLDTLDDLLRSGDIVIEGASIVASAVHEARTTPLGLADILIAESASAAGATQLVTFDKLLARRARAARLT